MTLTINCDGGSRGNPGPAASAFVVLSDDGGLIYKQGQYLGETTNNQAEYQAVLQAVEWLDSFKKDNSVSKINFILDSQLVVNQLNGVYKIKDSNLLVLVQRIRRIIGQWPLGLVSFTHVLRHKNFLADELVNQTLDQQ